MADITRYPFLRHLRGTATTHVRHLAPAGWCTTASGRRSGTGPLTAVISEVPVDDRELPLMFHARTGRLPGRRRAGHRHLPGGRPGRGGRPDRLLHRPGDRRWRARRWTRSPGCSPRRRSSTRSTCWPAPLTEALVGGSAVRTQDRGRPRAVTAGWLRPASRVVGVRVVAIRPEPDMERALRTPDPGAGPAGGRPGDLRAAGGGGRAGAGIAENELQNQIELALREEQLVAQRGANDPPRGRGGRRGRSASRPRPRPGARVTAGAAAAPRRQAGRAAEGEAEAARLRPTATSRGGPAGAGTARARCQPA